MSIHRYMCFNIENIYTHVCTAYIATTAYTPPQSPHVQPEVTTATGWRREVGVALGQEVLRIALAAPGTVPTRLRGCLYKSKVFLKGFKACKSRLGSCKAGLELM